MSARFTEDETGKTVINANGEELGMVTAVEDGVAHVEPNPGITDTIKAALGWGDTDENVFTLQEESIAEITDDEVHLRGDLSSGGERATGTGASTGVMDTDTGMEDDRDGGMRDDDDLMGDDDRDGGMRDDEGMVGSDDSRRDDELIGDEDSRRGRDDEGLVGGDDGGLVGDDDDDGLIGDDDDDTRGRRGRDTDEDDDII